MNFEYENDPKPPKYLADDFSRERNDQDAKDRIDMMSVAFYPLERLE